MDDRNPYRRPMWIPWALMSAALFLVAILAFSMGSRYEPVYVGGHFAHAWFPGFFLPLILFFIFFGGLRRMWWWGGYPYRRPWRYRRYRYDPYEEERDWEEWHRREHERMAGRDKSDPAPGDRRD